MRRKPLLVVGVSAAMLVGGVVLATTAGAQETPGVPGLPGFTFPGFALPYFGGDDQARDDQARDDQAVDDQARDGRVGDDQARGAGDAGRQGQDAGDRNAAGSNTAQHNAVQGNAAQNGAAQGNAAQGGAAAQGDAAQDKAVQGGAGQGLLGAARPAQQQAARPQNAQPAAQRPAVQRDQNAVHQGAARQSIADAARATVTSADVSRSPASPVQQRVLFLVNQNRRKGGCESISLDRRLIDAANEHAADMARHDYFAHESRNGEGAGDRVQSAGYRWRKYGENIARGQSSAWQVVNGWMHSPEHRENIMNCALRQMGVGLAISGDDTPYWVQDFATPMT
jgi:uncharacterized protein YkwD